MSGDAEAEQAAKKHRWEGLAGGNGGGGDALPTRTRWSAMTPRQYGAETPRVLTGLAAEQSTWRGMATPTATPLNARGIPSPPLVLGAAAPL
ncbi:unnamed protein product [Phytomonas sp. EM1]|nr:unnamed protein product [Phytomonas sp. EM1]|eukprot:CCW62244.1 unnamed protein product [Phytomonas sp. isolate EM1]